MNNDFIDAAIAGAELMLADLNDTSATVVGPPPVEIVRTEDSRFGIRAGWWDDSKTIGIHMPQRSVGIRRPVCCWSGAGEFAGSLA